MGFLRESELLDGKKATNNKIANRYRNRETEKQSLAVIFNYLEDLLCRARARTPRENNKQKNRKTNGNRSRRTQKHNHQLSALV